MNILILSSAFQAPYLNARLRYQCDYLTQQGHQVEVYTEPWDSLDFKHKYKIHEIGNYNQSYFKWLLISFYSLFTNYKERKFALQVLWNIRKKHFDVIMCSTSSCFPLGAAAFLSKWLHLPLHADLYSIKELDSTEYRDICWWNSPLLYCQQKLYIHRRNRALRRACSVSTISQNHADFIRAINPHIEIINNGFDPAKFYHEDIKSETFKVCYFGYLDMMQNRTLIHKVMRQMKDELPDIQWLFYSNEVTTDKFATSVRPTYHGMLPDEILGDAIRQSSVILLIHNKEQNDWQSELFYQALGCEKPVIFTPATNGMIPEFIQRTNLGISTKSTEEFKDFIIKHYQEWQQNKFTHQEVTNKDSFDASLQAKKLEQLLLSAIEP
ncbi:MAG: glycosyltransferase [Paludibacteraceae bacterium]|nr:glycosyltransferase [Paludibacteraceae bacterium]